MVRPSTRRCGGLLLLTLAVTLCHADEPVASARTALADADQPPWPTSAALPELRILDEQHMQVNGKYIVRDLGSDLVLTCLLNQSGPAQPRRLAPKIVWYIPSPAKHSKDRIVEERLANRVRLSVTNLKSLDSGNFSCEAQVADEPILRKSFHLHVRRVTSDGCPEGQFLCRQEGNCISKIFVCDGMPDCGDGLDEVLETCGKHVTCDDTVRPSAGELLKCAGRCRPLHYCCFQGNCSTGHYINDNEPCCKHYKDFTSSNQYRPFEHGKGVYDRTYLETAIYTIIGCAVAFILIVSIMIVAFCRVHLRQSARLSSYSHMRAARAAAAHPPLADLDHLIMGGGHFPAYCGAVPGHMMVTYNINNGVQVMPLISPPSYSEAVRGGPADRPNPAAAPAGAAGEAGAAPPQHAGPPPPYASRETLAEQTPTYGSENNNGDINGNSVAGAGAVVDPVPVAAPVPVANPDPAADPDPKPDGERW